VQWMVNRFHLVRVSHREPANMHPLLRCRRPPSGAMMAAIPPLACRSINAQLDLAERCPSLLTR
jgi:hypothetical protein